MLVRVRQRLRTLDLFAVRGVDLRTRKGMWALWMDNLFASISGAFLLTYVSLFAIALGATNTQIGALSSVPNLLGMLAPLPGAQLAEHWGSRRRVVVVVWALARALSAGLVVLPWFLAGDAAIYAVIALWSLRSGLANLAHPAWVSLAGEVIPDDRRGRFFSSRNIAAALCSMVFVPLAGVLIEWIGEPAGYQWAFGLSAVFGFAALYYYAQIPETIPPRQPRARATRTLALFWRALTANRVFLFFTLISMGWNFSLQLAGPFFNVFQVKQLGTSVSTMGWLGMALDLMTVVGQWFWGRVVDRRGSRWALAVCSLFIPILPFIWFFLSKPWHAVLVRIPSGFLWSGFNLASFNLQLELSTPQERTQAAAAYTTLIGLANILGPLVGGVIVDRWGYYLDFSLSGVGRLLMAVMFLWLLKPFASRPK